MESFRTNSSQQIPASGLGITPPNNQPTLDTPGKPPEPANWPGAANPNGTMTGLMAGTGAGQMARTTG